MKDRGISPQALGNEVGKTRDAAIRTKMKTTSFCKVFSIISPW